MYLKGDATKPQATGNRIIAHISNNKGGWGSGFVLALSKRWSAPECTYLQAKIYNLGDIQVVQVEPQIHVINMIAQNGFRSTAKPVAVDYKALEICLTEVAKVAVKLQASVHMPRIGAGLGGGDWNVIESIIEKTLQGIDVFVYDLL
jgi:O-acetyl-ADP-ribose deacetylase (regulator of RNase III)